MMCRQCRIDAEVIAVAASRLQDRVRIEARIGTAVLGRGQLLNLLMVVQRLGGAETVSTSGAALIAADWSDPLSCTSSGIVDSKIHDSVICCQAWLF